MPILQNTFAMEELSLEDYSTLSKISSIFTKNKKLSIPIRIVLVAALIIHFFGIYQLPTAAIQTVITITILNLLAYSYEQAKNATVEVAEIRCKACDVPMYSKIVKCPKCGAYRDLDEKKPEN
ncbi:MAG: hypothetical protein ACREBU_10755 [Nitrososphaera sp.]